MSKTINSDLIRGNINTIILKSLYGGDRYGYDIIKEIEEKSHGQYILKQPTLYSCLKRLESQGFVSSYWGAQSNGGRRKYYTLTDMGREVFVQSQDEYEYSRTIIDQLISERDYDLDSLEQPYNSENRNDDNHEAEDTQESVYALDHFTPHDIVKSSASDDEKTAEQQNVFEAEDDIELIIDDPKQENDFDNTVATIIEVGDNADDDEETFLFGQDAEQSNNSDETFNGYDDDGMFLLNNTDDYDTTENDESESIAISDGSDESEPKIAAFDNNCETQISDAPENITLSDTQDATQSEYHNDDSSALIDTLLYSANDRSYTDNIENETPTVSSGNGGKNFFSNETFNTDFYDTAYSLPNEQFGFAYDEEEIDADFTTSATQIRDPENSLPPIQDSSSSYSENDFISYHTNENFHDPIENTANYNRASDYKNLLSSMVDNFDTESDIRPITAPNQADSYSDAQIDPIPEETLSVKEKVQVRNFGKLSQSIRELGEDVKIRTSDNNAVHEFNKQYYYYRNKLLIFQYGILFVLMLLESFIVYISIKTSVKVEMSYAVALYVCSILLSVAFPITAGIMYLFEPYKRKRIDFNFKNSIIFRIIIMLQLILIIYALNVYVGMPIGGSPEYLLSMILPCILTSNVPISAVIFNYLYRSKLFAVD